MQMIKNFVFTRLYLFYKVGQTIILEESNLILFCVLSCISQGISSSDHAFDEQFHLLACCSDLFHYAGSLDSCKFHQMLVIFYFPVCNIGNPFHFVSHI